MGGWIALVGSGDELGNRIDRFRRVFSVPNVPPLRINQDKVFPDIAFLSWAWNDHAVPDVQVACDGHVALLLCGVITDMGLLGPLPTDLNLTALKVLELLRDQGSEIIEQLNGSFSCLFFDGRTRHISFFTDRFASRSVWYTEDIGVWLVGNYPSAVATVMNGSRRIDPAGLWSLFHAGRHVGSRGLFSNIRTLLGGQRADILPSRGININHWWQRVYRPDHTISPSEWGFHLSGALRTSAARYKKVCGSPHLFLSGGLDSRIAAAAYGEPLKTITLCTNPNVESRIASLVSRTIGLENQRIIRSPYWYLESMNASALISSGNYLNHHTHFIKPVQQLISGNRESEFLLGDLLENFNKNYFSAPHKNLLGFSPEHIKEILFAYAPYTIKDKQRIGIYFQSEIRKKMEGYYTEALMGYAQSLSGVSDEPADLFNTFLRWADVSITPTYNMFTCIWPFAKERNIYFDNELDDLSLKIPADLRGKGVLHKWIIYHLNKRLLLIPDANYLLPPFMPNRMKMAAKKIRPFIGKLIRGIVGGKGNKPVLNTSGSWLLLHEMYRKDNLYRSHIESIIFNDEVFSPELFDSDNIHKVWEEYSNGNISLHTEIESLISFGSLQRLIPSDSIDI